MMTECPRCESPQKFSRRQSKPENGVRTVFIECKMCGWRLILKHTTDEIEKLLRTHAKFMALATREKQRNGRVSARTRRQSLKILHKLNSLKNDLEVGAYG